MRCMVTSDASIGFGGAYTMMLATCESVLDGALSMCGAPRDIM